MASIVCGQARNAPHAGYAFPAGGRQGTSFDVVVGGQFLRGARSAIFSGVGVRAEIGEYYRPMTPKQAQLLRDKIEEARKKNPRLRLNSPNGLAALAKEAGVSETELRDLQRFRREHQDPKRQPNAQIAETVTLHVTVAANASVGLREVRLLTPSGLSNPIRFFVGDLPETTEQEQPVQIPAVPQVVNGQILPGSVDRYSFHSTKGKLVSVRVAARELIPYLADAVPGWFQAAVSLVAPNGKRLAFADHDGYKQDPALSVMLPADGAYTVEVRDALYRGREDFVYRMTLSEAPPPSKTPRAKDYVPTLVTLPFTGQGTLGQTDVYRFKGHKDQDFVAEIRARRLGSPLDSNLQLVDSSGRQVAFNDDYVDKAAAMDTHQADSYLRVKVPADDTYSLKVRDTQGLRGSACFYTLRMGAPQPDFELRILPSSLSLRPGTTAAFTIAAIRRDGFAGGINLGLVKAPEGFQVSGWIPANQESAQVTLTVPASFSGDPVALKLEGWAEIQGHERRHLALPADDMQQAFSYRHLVPAQDWLVATVGIADRSLVVSAPAKPVSVASAGETEIRLPGSASALAGRLKVTIKDAIEGLSVVRAAADREGITVVVRADPAKIKPGMEGNLIFEATAEPLANRPSMRRFSLGVLPATPFRVGS